MANIGRPVTATPPGIFTMGEVCKIARLSRPAVLRAIKTDQLRAEKLLNSTWRISERAIRDWLSIPPGESLPNTDK